MRWLGAFCRRLDDAQLGEWDKDDSLGTAQLRLQNLDHRYVRSVELQHAPPGARRRIVYALDQLDDVEGGDFVGYSHDSLILRGWIGGNQPWRSAFDEVVPGNYREGAATVEKESWLNFTSDSVRRAITHILDRGSKRRRRDYLPKALAINEADAEHTLPFTAVSFCPKDPQQLRLLVPGIRSAGKWLSNFRRPRFPDARDANFTRVRLRSILRVVNRTKLERSR